MFALLAAVVLTVPAGEPDAPGLAADEVGYEAAGDSSPGIPTRESGDPNQETSNPVLDPPPQVAPDITDFITMTNPDSYLSVEGNVTDDESPSGCTVTITWLGNDYEVEVESTGCFFWGIQLGSSDEGTITAVAVDSGGLESEPVQDLIY